MALLFAVVEVRQFYVFVWLHHFFAPCLVANVIYQPVAVGRLRPLAFVVEFRRVNAGLRYFVAAYRLADFAA